MTFGNKLEADENMMGQNVAILIVVAALKSRRQNRRIAIDRSCGMITGQNLEP